MKSFALCVLLIVLAEVAEARIVTIRWSNPNPSAVTGFRIYTRAPSQSFGAPAYDGKPVAVAGVYSIQLTVSDMAGTYVAATAYDSVGESARSNELFYAVPVVCGNGILQSGEACDDGNKTAGDGCSATCTVEVPVCGNGIREFGEGCDDGNIMGGDGCAASCVVEANPNAPREYMIDVGGPGFTTSSGQVWLPDTSFASGGYTAVTDVPVDLTNNDQLYQTQRYGAATGQPLVLEFPVPGTGPYRVRLQFAELDAAITQPGMRVFNVVVEDAFQLSDVDVFRSVGFARAYSRYLFVNVDDGVLTLRFEPVVGKPMLAGIEISEQAPPTSAPEFVDPCVESPADCRWGGVPVP